MFRPPVRFAAAVLLAVGLLFAAPAPAASAKAKKVEKKSSARDSKKSAKASKKDAKSSKKDRTAKASKRDKNDKRSKKGSKRSDDRVAKSKKSSSRSEARVAKSTPRRGKNTGDDDDDDRPSSRSRRTSAPSPAVASRAASVDKFDDDDDDGSGDDVQEPAGPRPANRVVSEMSTTRVSQIQTALIGKGLLSGPANGVYDQPTFQAMAAFQTRNGWNPVGVPTADSLKALGVPKNSGRGFMTPSRVVEATAPVQR